MHFSRAWRTLAPPPLQGFKILDLTRILAGPFCTMLLADMGADVIKIEHPTLGDDTRSWGPPFSASGREAAYFLGVNRNKRSVAVDLKSAEGVAIVKRLAAECDVMVENFVPGKMKELGLDFTAMSAANPNLVYASLSGFGQTGPKSAMPAYDVMISAVGGLLGITGTADGDTCKVGVAITDICTGLVLHGAILAALLSRTKTGRGQHIETSLLDTQVSVLANVASAYLVSGFETKPQGTAHASIVPYQRFTCADGSLVLGALNDGQFRRLCAAIEVPAEVAGDPRFATNAQRVQHREALLPILAAILQRRGVAAWIACLEAAGVPCAPINTIAQVFDDPQVIHNRRVLTVEHPTVGLLKLVAPPATFHGSASPPLRPPPLLGEHTREVVAGLGIDQPELDRLVASGVLRCTEGPFVKTIASATL